LTARGEKAQALEERRERRRQIFMMVEFLLIRSKSGIEVRSCDSMSQTRPDLVVPVPGRRNQ
jgi:hypothetical protein